MNSPYRLPVDNCLTCHQRKGSYFCALSKESLEAYNQTKQAVVYPEHTVIFVEGQIPIGILMLCQGKASFRLCPEMDSSSSCRLQRPEKFSACTQPTDTPHELTVETMQPCQLNFVGRDDFLLFLKQHSDACLRAAQHLSRDYQDACAVIRSVGSLLICERLAKFLLKSSAERQVANGVARSKLAMTHEDLSQLIGSSRETVTGTLSEVRKMGIVELKGSTLIVRKKAALEICGGLAA